MVARVNDRVNYPSLKIEPENAGEGGYGAHSHDRFEHLTADFRRIGQVSCTLSPLRLCANCLLTCAVLFLLCCCLKRVSFIHFGAADVFLSE